MRKLHFFLVVSILSMFCSSISALDVGALFHLTNIDFSSERKATETEIEGTDYLWGISLYGIFPVADSFTLTVGNIYDPVLRNTFYNLIGADLNYLKLQVGPFFGLFHNADTIVKTGLATRIRIDIPGIMFFSFVADSSMSGRLARKGDYIQEKSAIEAGFYVTNAICSIAMNSKTYSQHLGNMETVYNLMLYSFRTDIFKKNAPYRVQLTFGYQSQTIDFITIDTVTHTLNSIVMGIKLTTTLNKDMNFILDLDSNIYSFGKSDDLVMTLPDSFPGMYLFRMSTGIIMHL